jgi:6-phosphogluconolactonase/glucosamine-6-phosphate isomerase/deaminase
MLDIRHEPDALTAARHAAESITHLVASYKDIPILFLVSGGSPLEILKVLSSDGFDARVTVGVSDERFDANPMINNFAQIMSIPWYQDVVQKGIQSIDTRPLEGETLEECGERFDRVLVGWKQKHPEGKIVITQGIGLDGHTAGIMPYPEDPEFFEKSFVSTKKWAVGYDAKEKNKYPKRVTTTMPFLREVDHSVMFVCGEDKKEPLSRALAKEGSLAATPSRIIHEMKHCLLFTDLSV